MNKHHGSGWLGALIVFLAAMYSGLLFGIKPALTSAQWIIYAFTMLAFALLAADVLLPFGGVKQYPMLNMPMSRMAFVYFLVQLIVGTVILYGVPGFSPLAAFITGLVILCAYAACTLLMTAGASHIINQDERDHRDVSALRTMKAELDTIAAMTADASLKATIAALAESVQYSDPKSVSGIAEIEERLNSNISLLREEVEDGETERAAKRTEKIRTLIGERTAMLRALKR